MQQTWSVMISRGMVYVVRVMSMAVLAFFYGSLVVQTTSLSILELDQPI